MSELQKMSATRLCDLLKEGQVSPTEVTRDFLDGAIARNNLHGAFTAITEDRAMQRARELERRRGSKWQSLDDLPPLWGMPHADKDLEEREGVPTGYGSAAGGKVAAKSGEAAELADALGTVSLGKTNTPEFGMYAYTEPAAGSPARHPWNPYYGAGGSSGGSATAVAAGSLPFAIGSDGGGSIRVPAATVGIVGLKPTRGAIAIDRGPSVTGIVHGPMARSVSDARLLFDAMRTVGEAADRWVRGQPGSLAGTVAKAGDAASARFIPTGSAKPGIESARELTRPPACDRLRFAWASDSPWNPTYDFQPSKANAQALADALAMLQTLGVGQFAEVSLADAGYGPAFTGAWMRVAASLPADVPLEALEPLTAEMVTRGRAYSKQQVTQNEADLQAYRTRALALFEQCDVLVTPCLGMDPLPVGSFPADLEANFRLQSQYSPYTSWVNIAGLPALTLPVGVYGLEGGRPRLPFGIQLVGAPGSDDLLLDIGEQLEKLVGPLERPARDPGDAWVTTSTGQRLWGRFGAAGLLAWDPRRDAVLLQLRAPASHHGGTWGIPGGARRQGETAIQAALREAGEEAGVPPAAVRPLFEHVVEIEQWSYTTVVAEVTQSFSPQIQDWESDALEWVPVQSVSTLPLHPGFGASWPHLREKLGG